jgi:hypothetical protein
MNVPLPDVPQELVSRIFQEERVRLQIKTQLESTAADKKLTFWTFLNSGVGLLILTSLLVTGLGTALGWWHEGFQRRQTRLEAARKLFAEYDARLGQIRTYTAEVAQTPDADKKGELIMYEYYAARGTPEYQPTSPDFRGVPLTGILVQLQTLGYQDKSADRAMSAARDLDTGVEMENGKEMQSPRGFRLFSVRRLQSFVDALQVYRETAWKKMVD